MRLLTHNTMRNNTATATEASTLHITAVEVRVDEQTTPNNTTDTDAQQKRREIEFAKHVLPILNWSTLIQGAKALGLDSLPLEITTDLANDEGFLQALYHVLMNVHLVRGMLKCSETGREFPVTDGIVNMMLEEDECE